MRTTVGSNKRTQHRRGVVLVTFVSVCVVITFFATLYTMHRSLDLQERLPRRTFLSLSSSQFSNGVESANQLSSSSATEETLASTKFLIFNGFMIGQVMGNAMNGLLATHLLGFEFNRTVCVSPDALPHFHAVFAASPDVEKACNWLWKQNRSTFGRNFNLNNFGAIPDECTLQRILASNETVYKISGNTYPRWPEVPPRFFTSHYRPSQQLIQWLPKPKPATVVHLRAPDSTNDGRAGLDDTFLANLFQLLGKDDDDTYLVTNQVDLYAKFPRCTMGHHLAPVHTCAGANLGRLEASVAIGRLEGCQTFRVESKFHGKWRTEQ